MSLTPDEQAALDGITPTRAIHTVITAFETFENSTYLMIPVPTGPDYEIGDRVTITLEETR